MPDKNIEQYVNTKFLVKFKETATKAFSLLCEVCEDVYLSGVRGFQK
jgi:hypothetical protein